MYHQVTGNYPLRPMSWGEARILLEVGDHDGQISQNTWVHYAYFEVTYKFLLTNSRAYMQDDVLLGDEQFRYLKCAPMLRSHPNVHQSSHTIILSASSGQDRDA